MKFFYAESTGGFYNSAIHGDNIPPDSVEITAERHLELLSGQSSGLLISSDESGMPILLNIEPLENSPSQVTRAQGKAALIRSGLWQGVLSYVASIEDETEKAVAEIALNDTTHWQRTSPFLNEAAMAIGLTDEQLDDLFLQASKIEL